jgi:hypothetical protein
LLIAQGLFQCIGIGPGHHDQISAQALDQIDFGLTCQFGHINAGSVAQACCGPSDGSAVIAAAGGDKAGFGHIHREQRIYCAAGFEAAGMLHLLEFEGEGHTKDIGFQNRGAQHMGFNARPSLGHILCCHHGLSPLLDGMNAGLCGNVLTALAGPFGGRL